jgi:hypothetical protein
MEWLLFESLIALLVAVGIVWWTMSGRRKDVPPAAPDGQDDKRQ